MKELDRRDFIKAGMYGLGAISLGTVLEAADKTGGKSQEKPNIILLVTDDQRWDTLGCAGHPIIRTANMDKLAGKGVRFKNAFVTTSICAASRASIFTGLVERTHGYTFGKPAVPQRYTDNSYPVLLSAAGYRTGFVGKYDVDMVGGHQKMFDSFVEFELDHDSYFKEQPDGTVRHLTDITGDKAIDFLRTCRPGLPFCLSVSFNAPHADHSDSQYVWPKSVDHLYRNVTIPEPKLAGTAFFEAQPEFLRTSLSRKYWYWRFDTPEKYQKMVKGYYRMISGIDAVIGRIMEELKKRGTDKNTIIILTSDNGYFLGERGYAGKWLPYEDSLRIPLIVYDPRTDGTIVARGTTPGQMALNIDIAPTILALAGTPIPPTMQGRSLVPILKGRPKWREDFFFEHLMEHKSIPKCEGIRSANWKYIRYFEQQPVYEELYDLSNDKLEMRNLVDDPSYAGKLGKLRERCNELRDLYGGVYKSPEEKNSKG